MRKRILLILAFAAGMALAGWLSLRFFAPDPPPVESSTVLLEKIEKVAKLITVEGQFTELYNYNAYQGYFTWFWDKKVMLRVRAKVSAGYDLNQLQITVDSARHVIRMSRLPEPQILSIDHSLDYYDISTGIFSEFSPEDYNRINQRAKELIREQALKSSLLPAAREQRDEMIDLIRFLVESAGWTFVYQDEAYNLK